MKIKEGFVLRTVMGNNVAVATKQASKSFRGMIQLNNSAADIWKFIEQGLNEEEICIKMQEKYDAEPEKIQNDVKHVISVLSQNGILEL